MEKRLLLIIALTVTLIIVNDLMIWLLCREIYKRNDRNITNYYEFYNLDSLESVSDNDIKEREE